MTQNYAHLTSNQNVGPLAGVKSADGCCLLRIILVEHLVGLITLFVGNNANYFHDNETVIAVWFTAEIEFQIDSIELAKYTSHVSIIYQQTND